MTIPVQKLICCIIRTQERFGSSYVIDVLLGSKQKRIIDNGHDRISTWGIGKELCKDDWFQLIDLCIAAGYLTKYGEYSILQITEDGYALLSSKEKVLLQFRRTTLAFPKKSSGERISTEKRIAEKPAADDHQAEEIIKALKAWRRRKADDMNVPPYVIFGDKTLYDIAAKKPGNRSSLLQVYGIGEAKADQFGKSIIAVIEDVMKEEND